MHALVIGGSGSGKSAFAESLLETLPSPRYYIATMESAGAAAQKRIARHRAMREGKGFLTCECPRGLDALRLPHPGSILLEGVTTWCANECFGGGFAGAHERLRRGAAALMQQAPCIFVCDDLFSDGVLYEAETAEYLKILAAFQSELAAKCTDVYEIVCGLPLRLKGGAIDR